MCASDHKKKPVMEEKVVKEKMKLLQKDDQRWNATAA